MLSLYWVRIRGKSSLNFLVYFSLMIIPFLERDPRGQDQLDHHSNLLTCSRAPEAQFRQMEKKWRSLEWSWSSAGSPDSVCLRWPTGQMCSRPRWSLLYLCHGHHIIKFTIIKCDHQPSVNIHFTTSLCPIVPMGPDPVNVCVSQCFILHCVCSKTNHMSQQSSSYCVNRWCDQSFVFGSKSSRLSWDLQSLSHSATAERSFVRYENADYL